MGKVLSGKVSPTIADDIKQSSLWAVLASLVVVFLYILFRFKKWQFSLGAVAAVFHDVLIVLGIFSLTYKYMPFNMEIDPTLVVLMSMFFLGAESLRGLLFALIVGVLVGTYSSVFIATPIMRDTIGKSKK